MAGVKSRGPKSVQNKRMYNGEEVRPCRYYSDSENVKGRMVGLDANGEIIRDKDGNPKPFKSI
tara:strand:+ start:1735 stop:1923 length:189 start_codon:yes stop_codon:yes gene_type:complete